MTIQTVPLSSLQPPAANPRSVFDGAALDGLAVSIKQDGLLQNLVVVPGEGQELLPDHQRRAPVPGAEACFRSAATSLPTTASKWRSAKACRRTTGCVSRPWRTCSGRTCPLSTRPRLWPR